MTKDLKPEADDAAARGQVETCEPLSVGIGPDDWPTLDATDLKITAKPSALPGLQGAALSLEEETKRFMGYVNHFIHCAERAEDAKRDRLREALAEILVMVREAFDAPMTSERWLERIEDLASAALRNGEGE